MEKANIIELIKEFFTKLKITCDSLEVEEKGENGYSIKIKTPDSGIVIGPKGKNLEALKYVLKIILIKQLDRSVALYIEVNDYIESREGKLHRLIDSKIDYVKKTGKDIRLSNFTPYERKLIHDYVSTLELPNIFTKSIGEGEERALYICKKNENITIDMDGNDI